MGSDFLPASDVPTSSVPRRRARLHARSSRAGRAVCSRSGRTAIPTIAPRARRSRCAVPTDDAQGAVATKDGEVMVEVKLKTSRRPHAPALLTRVSVADTIQAPGSADPAGHAFAISDEPTARNRIA